jgi:polygalacturonase
MTQPADAVSLNQMIGKVGRAALAVAVMTAMGCGVATAQVKPAPGRPAPTVTLNVRDLGAVADRRTKDTAAFQAALDQVAEKGGGEVVVPAGEYVIGAIELKSNTTLRFEKGASLYGSPDLADYKIGKVRWEGRWVDGYQGLIYARGAKHIAIVGPGRIVGNSTIGGREMPRRPTVIEPIECDDVLLDGFYAEQTRMWTIHPTLSDNVVARNLVIRGHGGNSDGIDVDSCRHVRIENCNIDAGDDPIAIKSGRGMEGFTQARPTEDVLISNCVLGDTNFAGIGIGSETSGGIRNVRIEHVKIMHAKTYGIYIKSRPGRGAYIEDIVATDIDVSNAEGFLRFNLTNSGIQDPEPVLGLEGVPTTKNFRFSNIKINGGTLVEGWAVPNEKPLEGFVLTDVTGTVHKGMMLVNIKNAVLARINVTGATGPLLQISNVEGKGLKGAVTFEPPAQAPIPR